MDYKKIQKEDILFISMMILFLYHQYISILIGGTIWDDPAHVTTSKRIIQKAILFFNEPNNPFLSEFESNYEFYGYVIAIPVFIVSNNDLVMSIFQNILQNNPNVNLNNFEEFNNIVRFNTISVYVVVSLSFVYKLLNNFYSKGNSLLAILFLILIPSFNGQALFNIKDIPFALQLFLASLYLIVIEKKRFGIHNASLKEKIIMLFLISSILLIRLNGIIFIGLCSVYLLISSKEKVKYIKNYLYLYVGSIVLFFLGSPSSWQKPKLYITETIKTQFFLEWTGATLTNGKFIYAIQMEPDYLTTWLFYRLPIIFHLALIISTIIYFYRKNTSEIFKFSIFYIYTVNIVFIIYLPVSYDGIRQYLFLLPFFSIILVESTIFLRKNLMKKFTVFFIVAYLLFTQSGLGSYKYVYFNEFVNENAVTIYCEHVGGCGDWPTDYLAYSGKEISNKALNLGISEVYVCEPTYAFSTYLDNKLKIVNSIPTDEEFIILNIHRPMLSYDTCGFIDSGRNYSCELVDSVTRQLRGVDVNLSYIQKCKFT